MHYTGRRTSQISFPLGGIGSGSIGLAGNGALVDFEVRNRPNKRGFNGLSGFAIRAEGEGQVLDARVLQSDLQPPYVGEYVRGGAKHSGYGYGPAAQTLAGLRHFAQCDFDGEFPLAELRFVDETFPAEVRMSATNPFIPLNEDDSSIPGAFFELHVRNTTAQPLTYTACLFLGNPYPQRQSFHAAWSEEGITGVTLGHLADAELPEEQRGEMSIATDGARASYQRYWYRGGWCDALEMFWNDFTTPGPLRDRDYAPGSGRSPRTVDEASLAAEIRLQPGESGTLRFLITWSFPRRYNDWNPEKEAKTLWTNYYAKIFPTSRHSAVYSLKAWDRLWTETRTFHDALAASTLPAEALEAVSANLSVLKSPTVMRLEDGSFYGFEGCIADEGCCEGSCTHVWNYAYALPFLFPRLERSMRTLDYTYNQREDGRMSFRIMLPLGRERMDFRACVDGQMGGVIKTYRDFKLCGDVAWLRSIWPQVKRSLTYAWAPTNEDRWDPAKSGVISGRQHHTLDMELFGANAWLQGFYLAALQAAAELAEVLGEADEAEEYRALFRKGYAWTEEHLFNGEYFVQQLDIRDKSQLDACRGVSEWDDEVLDGYWNEERGEIKYQIADGCGIDQVLAGWHARLCGLPPVFDAGKTRSALGALYANNFRTMREQNNTWRNFAVNGESGLVICTWPNKKPAVPLTYASECMTGFEYQAACHMILEGMEEEGLSVVRAVRDRYDGEKRNPWNEIECGSNYARSMASYSLLLAYSGFEYDMHRQHIGFHPLHTERPFRCFWSVDSAWGTVALLPDRIEICVLYGALTLRSLGCPLTFCQPSRGVTPIERGVAFARPVTLTAGEVFTVRGEPV